MVFLISVLGELQRAPAEYYNSVNTADLTNAYLGKRLLASDMYILTFGFKFCILQKSRKLAFCQIRRS